MNQFGWETFKATGKIPLWNPYLFGGTPFIASFAFRPFYPVNWIFIFLPFDFAIGYQYVINLTLAGIFFYFLCRCFNLSKSISFISGFLFMFSGHLATLIYPGHFNKIGAIAFLPLAFGSFYKATHTKKIHYFILCGFALSMQLLSSHFQIFYYATLLILFYLIYFIFSKIHYKKYILPSILGFILCLIVAISISGIQLFPALELSQNSNRTGGVTYDVATASSFPPEELSEIIFPRFNGDSLIGPKGFFLKSRGDYNGRWKERIVSDYVGMVSFLFFIIGLFYSKRKERFFFLFIFLFAIVLSLGKFTPLFKIFYTIFPGIKTFRTPASIMVLITFSIVVISALGLETVLKSNLQFRSPKDPFIKKYFLFSLSIIVIAFLILYLGIRFSLLNKIELNRTNLLYSTLQSFLFLILSLTALFIFLFSKKNEKNKKTVTIFLVTTFLISFLDLSFNNFPFIQTTKTRNYKMFLYNDPVTQAISQESTSKPVRIFEIGNELTNRYMPSKITSIHGYHPICLRDYKQFVDKLGFYNFNLYNLFYVKYLISRQPLDSDKLTLKNKFFDKYVYSMKKQLPYIYFPQKLKIFHSEKQNREEIKKQILDELSKEDSITSAIGIVEIPETKKSLPTISDEIIPSIELTKYSPDIIELSIDAPERCTMIISEVYEKNWVSLYDNSLRLEIYPANFLFRAVEIPEGKGEITFLYDPLSYRLGKLISIVAIILSCIISIISLKTKSGIKNEFSSESK